MSIYIFSPVSRHSLPSGAPRAYVDDGCSRRRLADVSVAFRRVRAGAYCCMPCAICHYCSNLVRTPLLFQRRMSGMPALAMTTGISSALCVGFQCVNTERLRTTQNSIVCMLSVDKPSSHRTCPTRVLIFPHDKFTSVPLLPSLLFEFGVRLRRRVHTLPASV